MLDVGAGTGRVALDLAAGGVAVVALDVETALLQALAHRAAGLPVETVVADARKSALGRRFSLVLVPMQTLQLLGGPRGRSAFLRRALDHLEPGSVLAAALADALDCFDEEHDAPPPAASREFGGVRYTSQLVSVKDEDEDGRAAIHRFREIVGPGERYESQDIVPQTEEYRGSTVVVLRAPCTGSAVAELSPDRVGAGARGACPSATAPGR